MTTSRLLVYAFLALAGLTLTLTGIPVSEKSVLYKPATDMMHGKGVWKKYSAFADHSTYIVVDNNLYLEAQFVRRAILMTTFVTKKDWSLEEVRCFRASHPELESYWPKPVSPAENNPSK